MLTDEERAITGGLSMDDYIWRENMRHEERKVEEMVVRRSEEFKKKRDILRGRMKKYMERKDMQVLSLLEQVLDAMDEGHNVEIKSTPVVYEDIPF